MMHTCKGYVYCQLCSWEFAQRNITARVNWLIANITNKKWLNYQNASVTMWNIDNALYWLRHRRP